MTIKQYRIFKPDVEVTDRSDAESRVPLVLFYGRETSGKNGYPNVRMSITKQETGTNTAYASSLVHVYKRRRLFPSIEVIKHAIHFHVVMREEGFTGTEIKTSENYAEQEYLHPEKGLKAAVANYGKVIVTELHPWEASETLDELFRDYLPEMFRIFNTMYEDVQITDEMIKQIERFTRISDSYGPDLFTTQLNFGENATDFLRKLSEELSN